MQGELPPGCGGREAGVLRVETVNHVVPYREIEQAVRARQKTPPHCEAPAAKVLAGKNLTIAAERLMR
jgi:hypothetical protein